MASTTVTNNNINTQLGNTLLTSVSKVFDNSPNLNQLFQDEVVKCSQENVLSGCTEISIAQLDEDITKADAILEWLLINDYPDKQTYFFMFQVILKFLQVKKCTNAQFPCWSADYYESSKAYLDNFDFTAP